MLGFRTCCALGVALVFLAGCDSATDGQPLDPRPPEVSDFTFSPASAAFDDVAEDDSARVTIAIGVRVEDDGAVDRVRYTVESRFPACIGGQAVTVISQGALDNAGETEWTGSADLVLARSQRGLHTVRVYAVGDDERLSNRVSGQFSLEAEALGPPTVSVVDTPDTFRPPGELRLVVAVEDPDGRADVARVEVDTPAGGTLELFGDPDTRDPAVCDGRYAIAFDVPEATPGPQTFVFRAIDRDGLESEDVPFTVTILE